MPPTDRLRADHSHRSRFISATVLTGAIVIALLLAVTALSGGRVSLKIGFLQLRTSEVSRPLAIAFLLATTLLICAWRSGLMRGIALALLGCTAMLTLIAVVRQAVPYTETGDFAIIEGYAHQAMRGELLLGPYSRYHWRHPGPLYFYLIAPFYWLSGYRTAGMWAGALTINLASMVIITWTVLRARNAALALAITGFLVLYVWRINALMTSQWNPHIVILPTTALIVVCAAIVSGRHALLPLAALLSAFAAQTYVGLLPLASGLMAIAFIAVIRAIPFSAQEERAQRNRRIVNRTLWLLGALWFLPLAEEVTRRPGNLTQLYEFFMESRWPSQPFHSAFSVWADMLTRFLRPGFFFGSGGFLREAPPTWTGIAAILQLILLCVVAVHAARTGQMFRGALAAMLVVVSTVALWSVTRIEGDFVPEHAVFWITGLSVLNVAILCEAALQRFSRKTVLVADWVTPVVCILLLALAASAGIRRLFVSIDRSRAPRVDQRTARMLATEIQAFLHSKQISKVRLEIDGDAWDVAAGVIVELENTETPFSVARDRTWMFGDVLAPTGEETAALMISTARRRAELLGQTQTVNIVQLPERGYFVDSVPLAFSAR